MKKYDNSEIPLPSSTWFSQPQQQQRTMMENGEVLVELTTIEIIISVIPFCCLIVLSWVLGLGLESPMIVGMIRTYIQLSVLGLILTPIFHFGVEFWWVTMLYVCFMIFLASMEASARPKYYFKNQLTYVLCASVFNVFLCSLFGFGVVIRPSPLWDPQYVIPLIGMMLNNIVNGVSLALNTMNTSLIEQQREVELALSFGATAVESSSRLIRESIRTSAMPMLNSMAVIGLISIPGMMTGQILGGTSTIQAARYQMLIMYLISVASFGIVFAMVYISVAVGFDSTHMFCPEHFVKRPKKRSFLDIVSMACKHCFGGKDRNNFDSDLISNTSSNDDLEKLALLGDGRQQEETSSYGNTVGKNSIQIQTMVSADGQHYSDKDATYLQVSKVARSIGKSRRILFQNFSFVVAKGEIVAIHGPSGAGKSQLLRILSALSPMVNNDDGTTGDIILDGKSFSSYPDATVWRQDVRYVTQYKVDIPGTPRDFIGRITSFKSWNKRNGPAISDMMSNIYDLIQQWGLDVTANNCLDKEWTMLSGGEAQRVILAIATASMPKVLLLDESTSALDLKTKTKVEVSIDSFASKHGMAVLWITHDQDQAQRMQST